jgi:hypothetical protein
MLNKGLFAAIARASQAAPLQLLAEPQQNHRRAMLRNNLRTDALQPFQPLNPAAGLSVPPDSARSFQEGPQA